MPVKLAPALRRGAAVALLIAPSVAALAQGGSVAVECVDPARAQDTVIFDLDPGRQTVTGAFPINWAWFAGSAVLFGHSVSINGRYQTTQSYVLDRATGKLEVCDFASGAERACGHRQCVATQPERPDALPAKAD